MNTNQIKQQIEDYLDSVDIPVSEYNLIVEKQNGDTYLRINRDDFNAIDNMFQFSEIINSYSTDWSLKVINNKINMIIR